MTERSGFTLIEMLVALAVFSLAAMALLNLSGENTRTAARVETRTLGGVVAENLAVEAATLPPIEEGTASRPDRPGGPRLALDPHGHRHRRRRPAAHRRRGQRRRGPGRRAHPVPGAQRMTRRAGFTLVEVLVSLMIFAMIAAAGAAMLGVTIDNRFAVKAASDERRRPAAHAQPAARRPGPGHRPPLARDDRPAHAPTPIVGRRLPAIRSWP